ncbi:MAG: hypothetical protein WBO55_05870 [Rhizobiaceae bacterium]
MTTKMKTTAKGLIAASLILASSIAFAASNSPGGRGGPGQTGGHEFEGPVPGVTTQRAVFPDSTFPRYFRDPVSEFDCDEFLRRAHGPATFYWNDRYRECRLRDQR